MKKLIAAAVAALAFHAGAFATPATPEAVERLLVVTRSERMLEGMTQQVNQMMKASVLQAAEGKNLTAAQRKQVEASMKRVMPKMRQVMADELSWARMKPFLVKLYQDTFTQEEIDGLTDFYESPLGIALLDKMPLVMKGSMDWSQQRMPFVMQRMEEILQEEGLDAASQQKAAKTK